MRADEGLAFVQSGGFGSKIALGKTAQGIAYGEVFGGGVGNHRAPILGTADRTRHWDGAQGIIDPPPIGAARRALLAWQSQLAIAADSSRRWQDRSTDREDDHGKGSEEKRSGTEEAEGQQEKEGSAGVRPEHSVEQGEPLRALIPPVARPAG